MYLLLWNFILSWKFFKAVIFLSLFHIMIYPNQTGLNQRIKQKHNTYMISLSSVTLFQRNLHVQCICEFEVANISESNRIDSSSELTTTVTFILVSMSTLSSIQQVWCHYLLIRNRLFDLHYFHCSFICYTCEIFQYNVFCSTFSLGKS